MWIYLITFGISAILIFLAENKLKNELICKVTIFIGLLFPCFLAGLRAETIGTDILVYVKPLFQCSKYADSFIEYLSLKCTLTRYVSDFEIGFSALVYIITKIGGNLNTILFFIQFFTTVPIYLGLKKIQSLNKKKWMGMLVYYLMFYNTSLNAMRQYISIAIIFYASCILLEEKKDLKCLITIFIATLFHKSAYLGLSIYFLYKTLNLKSKLKIVIGRKKIEFNKIIFAFIIGFGIISITNTKIITFLLNDAGLDYYSRYVDGDVKFASSSIIKALPIILIFMSVKKNLVINNDLRFLILMFIMNILMSQFATINVFAIRIAYLFSSFNIISFPYLSKCNIKRKRITLIILILYLLIYWYYNFVFSGYSETIPYSFS